MPFLVLLGLKGKGFSFEDAYALLSDLENELPSLNPYAMDDLRMHLGDMSIAAFQVAVSEAIERGQALGVPELNLNG